MAGLKGGGDANLKGAAFQRGHMLMFIYIAVQSSKRIPLSVLFL